MKSKLFSIIVILCTLLSCVRTLPDEALTMTRLNYAGKEIRLDGCYVSDQYENVIYCDYVFFYSNGIVFAPSDLLNIENINQFTDGIDNLRNRKGNWGIFHVENDTIYWQKWGPGDFTTQYIVYKRSYKIINDSTLSYNLNSDGRVRLYHFKKYTAKPDSTNVFIK